MSYFFTGDLITSNASTLLTESKGIAYRPVNNGHETILRGPKTGNASGITVLHLPGNTGSIGQVLQTDGTGVLSFATSVDNPAGSDTQIQYNNSGNFGAITGFTYNDGTDNLLVNTKLSSIVATNNTANALAIVSDGGALSTLQILNNHGTDEGALTLTATSGGIDMDAAITKDINISGGQVALVSKDNATSAISLTTNQGSSETIVVTNTQGTDNAAIELTTSTGGITAKVADEKELTLGNANGDAYFKVAASNTPANEDIRIVNTNGTDNAAIELTATSGGITLAPGTAITTSKAFITTPYTLTVADTSTLNPHQLITTTNNTVYLNLSDTDGNDIATIEVTGSNTAGQNMHLLFDNAGVNSLRLDFGNNLLTSGSGLARYLTFTNTGQSASLMYVGSKWRILNTFASVL